jgi:hypothetical protein
MPGTLKGLDGVHGSGRAAAVVAETRRLPGHPRAHFGYPDGYAATLLGRGWACR